MLSIENGLFYGMVKDKLVHREHLALSRSVNMKVLYLRMLSMRGC